MYLFAADVTIDVTSTLTPSDKDVHPDAGALREESFIDEHVKIEALHEDPHEAGGECVHKHGDKQLTLPVLKRSREQYRVTSSAKRWPMKENTS